MFLLPLEIRALLVASFALQATMFPCIVGLALSNKDNHDPSVSAFGSRMGKSASLDSTDGTGINKAENRVKGGALSKCKTTPDGPQVEVPCVFPFIYKGKEYNECTFQKGDVKAWCSTKVDGNGKHVGGQRQWGYCEKECPVQEEAQCRTTGGGRKNAPCIFPFKYKGKSYTKCVWQKDEPQPWCSTKVTKLGFHVGKQGQWGHCNEHCPMPTRPKEPDSEKEDANQKEGSMSTVDEIFIAEDNNPGDIRPGNDFDAGEYEYEYYDMENQPDLSNPERIAGAKNANKVSGSSGVSEIRTETKGCKRKCLQFKRVRKDGVLGNLVWKCVKKGCEAPSRDR